jgi:hypothetical protein
LADTFCKIATVTVGAGGAASINFTDIPQSYSDLVIFCSVKNNSTTSTENGSDWNLTFNGNTSSTYTRRIIYNTAALGSAAASGTDMPWIGQTNNNATSMANIFSNVQIYISNYSSSTLYKSVSSDSATEANATSQGLLITAGLWNNNSPITNITWTSSPTLMQYSTATLYGIRAEI